MVEVRCFDGGIAVTANEVDAVIVAEVDDEMGTALRLHRQDRRNQHQDQGRDSTLDRSGQASWCFSIHEVVNGRADPVLHRALVECPGYLERHYEFYIEYIQSWK